jgi:hypothetical protein
MNASKHDNETIIICKWHYHNHILGLQLQVCGHSIFRTEPTQPQLWESVHPFLPAHGDGPDGVVTQHAAGVILHTRQVCGGTSQSQSVLQFESLGDSLLSCREIWLRDARLETIGIKGIWFGSVECHVMWYSHISPFADR